MTHQTLRGVFMKKRKLHVVAQSGYNYKEVPAIILKGKWLSEYGFETGKEIIVSCKDKVLTIEIHD